MLMESILSIRRGNEKQTGSNKKAAGDKAGGIS